MHISISNRTLLHSLVAGAVVLAGTSACSRPDRADAGNDSNQPAVSATPADTQGSVTTATTDTQSARATSPTAASPGIDTAGTDQRVSGYQPMGRDTTQSDTDSKIGTSDRTDTVAVGDSAHMGKPGERLESTQASEQANEDTLANQPDSDRIRPPEDSSETSGAAAGSAEMARDTSMAVAQGDTMMQADTSAIQVAVDTTTDQQTEVAVETQPGMDTAAADTAVVVGDSAEAGKPGERLEHEVATAQANADTVATDVDRVRPPEDSTEVLGNVTTGEANAQTGNAEVQDVATAGAAGIESTGNTVTGANAVAQMSRQGLDCEVVNNPEEVRFDMASSPATLNPCGTGTMTLPRIVTGEE